MEGLAVFMFFFDSVGEISQVIRQGILQGILQGIHLGKKMYQPDTYNNIHDDKTNVGIGVFADHRGEYVPSAINTAFPTRGFQSFEVGTAAVIDGRWLGGDKYASWYKKNNPERCSLNIALGYADEQLKQCIPTIEADSRAAIQKLEALEVECLKLAFVDHRIKCFHKDRLETVDDYIRHANRLQKGTRMIEGNEYPVFHLSRILSKSGKPVLWNYDIDKKLFVEHTVIEFDDKPPHQDPLNYLPLHSIVIPRTRLVFYTNKERYGVKLGLDTDIRIVRLGHVAQVYANAVYLTLPQMKTPNNQIVPSYASAFSNDSKSSSSSSSSSGESFRIKRRRTNSPLSQPPISTP